MIKKILPISVFILIIVMIILLGLQNLLNKSKARTNKTAIPTVYEGKQGSGYNSGKNNTTDKTNNNNDGAGTAISEDAFKATLPIKESDFTLDHSDRLGKYVVTLQTDNGQEAYDQWLDLNTAYGSFLNTEQVMVTNQSISDLHYALDYAKNHKISRIEEAKKDAEKIMDILDLFDSVPYVSSSQATPTIQPTPTIMTSQTNSGTSGNGGYVYYAQCKGDYDNYLLPNQNGTNGQKCTECNAGCGPTTAAMILASYTNQSLTPPSVIEDMSKNGVSIGCDGSKLYEIYNYMKKQNGIELSSVMAFGSSKSETISDFKKYIEGGWTLFVLGKFKAGGHYFWVTDVTDNGDVLAYDPYYGSKKPLPFNENQYDPYPTYTAAFAVKKTNKL